MSDIIALKLVTGEEVVGELKIVNSPESKTLLHKPRVITIMRSPDGRQGLGLVPYAMSNMDATVTFNNEHVITRIDPIKPVIDAYLQETSGIQLASSVPPSPIIQS